MAKKICKICGKEYSVDAKYEATDLGFCSPKCEMAHNLKVLAARREARQNPASVK